MISTRSLYLCGAILLLCHCSGSEAQVCAESGRYAGLDASDAGNDQQEDIGNTYILHQYGEITCTGVISDWSFHKIGLCEDLKLQVWRGSNDYTLVGENYYNASTENCQLNVQEQVHAYIPAHKQIPVKTGDIIGWTRVNPIYNRVMIRYTAFTNFYTAKNFGSCNGLQPGENTATTCSNQPDVSKGFRLQAHVVKGLEPDIGNLPYTVNITENTPPKDLYVVEASHEKNNVGRNVAWWNPTPVELQFSQVSSPVYGLFSIRRENNGGNPVYTGIVSTTARLNFEQLQEHNVTVTVTGQGLETSSVLTVRVIDVNEEHSINNLPDTIDVSVKGAQIGDEIFQVTVSDPDTINPSVIEYFITSSDQRDPAPPFLIDQYTGIIKISEDVTHWYQPTTYILEITATDYMYNVIGQLTVNLIDTKNISIITNLNATIPLPEDAPDGSEIFQVLVSGTPQDTFLYKITEVQPFDIAVKFGIHQDGWIYLTSEGDLDYFDHGTIVISVQVLDGELKSIVKYLTIDLGWVNEPPVFQPKLYRVNMPEMCGQVDGLLPSCEVEDLTISWTQRNKPIFHPSCDILPSHGSDKFRITTGCTKLNVDAIDVNNDPTLMSVNLTLTISDAGPPQLGDTARVFISVYDINDNSPRFNPTTYAATVDENTPGGVSLFTVTATDKDFDRNGEIYYSITDPIGSYYFQVAPFTGVLSTKHPVEYDFQNGDRSFTFPVIATDRGLPNSRSDTATVTININDVNDNMPVINCWYSHTYPKGVDPYDPNYECFYNLDVRYDILINHNLMKFNATDVDAITPQPNFSILNVEPHFRMENMLGDGYLFTEEKLYKYHTYGLIIEANDMGTPSLKARPPSVVRVDTFDGPEHLVDITLGNSSISFNKTVIQTEFIQLVREFCDPWVIRLYAFSEQRDRTIVTVYAFEDNSTFLHENFDEEKYFVSLSDLLQKLRSSLKGTPRPEFEDKISEYIPLEVQPTYPKFLIHTLGGWITLACLFLLLLILIIIFIVCMCRCFSVCCFKKSLPTKHAWMRDKPKYDEDYYDTVKDTGTTVNRRTSAQSAKSEQGSGDGTKSDETSGSTGRRPSVDTVHSLIYDTKKA